MKAMKTLLCAALAAVLVIPFSACTSTDTPGEDTSSAAVEDGTNSDAIESEPEGETTPEGMKKLSFTSGTYGIKASLNVPEYSGWQAEEGTKLISNYYTTFFTEGVGEGDSAWDIAVSVKIGAIETKDTEKCISDAQENSDKYTKLETLEGITGYAKDEAFTKVLSFYTNDDYLGANPYFEVTIADHHNITSGVKDHTEVDELVSDIAGSVSYEMNALGKADNGTYLYNSTGGVEYPESVDFGGETVNTVIEVTSLTNNGSKEGTLTCEKDGHEYTVILYEAADYTDTMFEKLPELSDHPYSEDEIAGNKAYSRTIEMGGGALKFECYFDVGNGIYYHSVAQVDDKEVGVDGIKELTEEFVKGCKYYGRDDRYISTAVVE